MESPFYNCQINNPFIAMRNNLGIKYVPLTESQIKIRKYVLCNAYISTNIERTVSFYHKKIKKKEKEYIYIQSCGILFCKEKKPLKKLQFNI